MQCCITHGVFYYFFLFLNSQYLFSWPLSAGLTSGQHCCLGGSSGSQLSCL